MTRTSDPLLRNALAMAAAAFVVGLSFGAIAAAAGIPLLKAMAMSLLVFAGGAQFMAVGVVSAGGTALAAVLAGLLLNVRHLPFGLAIGGAIGDRWPAKVLGSQILVDETTAFALAQDSPAAKRRAFWLAGVAMYVSWNAATVIGVIAGSAVGDPSAFGVDAAFPAALLALVLPSLRERPALRVAVAGAVLALVSTPFLPPGMPVLVALLGLVFALPIPGKLGKVPGKLGRAAR